MGRSFQAGSIGPLCLLCLPLAKRGCQWAASIMDAGQDRQSSIGSIMDLWRTWSPKTPALDCIRRPDSMRP
jgi:hypothetical protein